MTLCCFFQSAEEFIKQAQTNKSLDINFPGTFHDDPTALLQNFKVSLVIIV